MVSLAAISSINRVGVLVALMADLPKAAVESARVSFRCCSASLKSSLSDMGMELFGFVADEEELDELELPFVAFWDLFILKTWRWRSAWIGASWTATELGRVKVGKRGVGSLVVKTGRCRFSQ